MDPMLTWGLVLLVAAILLIALEVFVPSAGAITLTAAAVAIAGIVMLFRYDVAWGFGGALSALILMPSVFFGIFQFWMGTKAGRRAMGVPSEEEVEARRLKELEQKRARDAMIGIEGLVLTDLRPVGVVELEGRRVDALAENGFIAAGSRVKVVAVDVTEVKVRQI